jgi:predicted RNA-binding Zn-ribbon protein involved in translation (DUF1610 family)
MKREKIYSDAFSRNMACPKCGGQLEENFETLYKTTIFECLNCGFTGRKTE